MSTKVAAAMMATIAECLAASADIVLTCSGTMEVPGVSTKQAYALSVTVDPIKKTVMVGDTGPIPMQSDVTDETITFGSATSPTFGILNKVTGAIFVSTFQPVATYRGVCSQIDR
jgi:hypothetical protein